MTESSPSSDRTAEGTYLRLIELLEKRIAQLEATTAKEPEPPASSLSPGSEAGGDAIKKAEVDTPNQPDKKDDNPAEGATNDRYRNVLRRWDKTLGDYKEEVVPPNHFEKPKKKALAYTYRRTYVPDQGEKGAYSDIEIEDEYLIKLLEKLIGKYPGITYDTELITMNAPFPALVHNWDKLQGYIDEHPEEQVSKDLAKLLGRAKNAPELEAYFKLRDSTDVTKVVTFETLWTAFAPGKLIVARPFMNVDQIMVIQDSPIPWLSQAAYRPLSLWAWTWDWDGRRLLKVEHEFEIKRFRGTKNVRDLSVVPLEHFEGAEALKEKVRERSRKFFKYTVHCKVESFEQVLDYDGLGYADESKTFADREQSSTDDDYSHRDEDQEKNAVGKLVSIKGAFVADASEYMANTRQNTSDKGFPIGKSDHSVYVHDTQAETEEVAEFRSLVDKLKPDAPLDPENNDLLVTPPRLLGYATRQRIWGQISLEDARPAQKPDEKTFLEKLQLDDRYKNMILSLVKSHMQRKDQLVRDVVENKGKGLVLLLHGPPGVGKTLTAETVAKAVGRPLFVVSVAEIGLDASRAERRLEKVFALATKWQAVLLIDEADVFLETRNHHSPASQNALVSVLLRVLEYYEGIIILTTNRVRAIDVAVISRIHLAVRYEDLTPDQTQTIFKQYLDQLQANRPSLIAQEDRDKIDEFLIEFGENYPFNGRQIRNVVQAAHAYAEYGLPANLGKLSKTGRGGHRVAQHNAARLTDGKMTYPHLKEVCDMTKMFQNQLKDESSSQRAENEVKGRR